MAATVEDKQDPCSHSALLEGASSWRGITNKQHATRNTKCAVWLRMSCQDSPSKELLLRLGLEEAAAVRQEQQPQARKPCGEEHPYTAD